MIFNYLHMKHFNTSIFNPIYTILNCKFKASFANFSSVFTNETQIPQAALKPDSSGFNNSEKLAFFVSELVQADGSFFISLYLDPRSKLGVRVTPIFSISQNYIRKDYPIILSKFIPESSKGGLQSDFCDSKGKSDQEGVTFQFVDYDLKSDKLFTKFESFLEEPLNPSFLVGFTEGDGSFIVSSRKSSRIVIFYTITSETASKDMLYRIKSFFNCGQVYSLPSNAFRYQVENFKDLRDKIIPFFKRNSLISDYKKEAFTNASKHVLLKASNKSNFVNLKKQKNE